MGKLSLPKTRPEDYFTPKNRYHSSKIDKDCKNRHNKKGHQNFKNAKKKREITEPRRKLSAKKIKETRRSLAQMCSKIKRDTTFWEYVRVHRVSPVRRAKSRIVRNYPFWVTGRKRQPDIRQSFHEYAAISGVTADANEILQCGLTRAQVEALQSRDLTPNDYAVLLQLDEKVEKKTLGADVVKHLITRSDGGAPDHGMKKQAQFDDPVQDDKLPVECGVCLSEIESHEEAVQLPCKHSFHEECIMTWLTKYNTKCPFKCETTVTADGAQTKGSLRCANPNASNNISLTQ